MSFDWTQFESEADGRVKFEIAKHKEVSARIHVVANLNFDERTITGNTSAQPSILKGGREFWTTPKGINIFGGYNDENNGLEMTAEYWAVNGTMIGPAIQIQLQINVDINKEEKIVDVTTHATGNVFPAQETQIFDQIGNGIFLGTSIAEGSPLTGVFGDGRENVLYDSNIRIITDDYGNFIGVSINNGTENESVMSIDSWNEQFIRRRVWSRKGSTYKEYYKKRSLESAKQKQKEYLQQLEVKKEIWVYDHLMIW